VRQRPVGSRFGHRATLKNCLCHAWQQRFGRFAHQPSTYFSGRIAGSQELETAARQMNVEIGQIFCGPEGVVSFHDSVWRRKSSSGLRPARIANPPKRANDRIGR
jgi:hypothetical protein